MERWSSSSVYSFGDLIEYNAAFYYCISSQTEEFPTDESDWIKVDKIVKGDFSDCKAHYTVYDDLSRKCFVFLTEWLPLAEDKAFEIVVTNTDPCGSAESGIWINEVDGSVFVYRDGWWEKVVEDAEEIVQFEFSPSRFDDDEDSAGNGSFTEGVVWVDSQNLEVFQNVRSQRGQAEWEQV